MTAALVVASWAGHAHAQPQPSQTPADLAAGRQLFTEALADEEHARFADALAKYKRVLAVRDTPNIRYRIGSSLEHLGKLVQASESYAAAIRVGNASGTSADAEVARAAQARLDALNPKIAHLTVRLTAPPPGTEVTLDGEPIQSDGAAAVAVDPGSHVVAATAPGTRPFRSSVDLTEGARSDVPVVLEPLAPTTAPPVTTMIVHPYRTAGIVTAAAGGVLLASGVIVLVLRSGAIGDLESACPGGACPASQRDDLQSKHDRAETEGPLGVVLVGAGVAAAAAGVVLMLLTGSEKAGASRIVPAPITRGAMLTFGRDL